MLISSGYSVFTQNLSGTTTKPLRAVPALPPTVAAGGSTGIEGKPEGKVA